MKRVLILAMLAAICISMTACMDWAFRDQPLPTDLLSPTEVSIRMEEVVPAESTGLEAALPETVLLEAVPAEVPAAPSEAVAHEMDATPKAGISDWIGALPYVSGASLTGLATVALTGRKKRNH